MKILKFAWVVGLLVLLMPVQTQDERGADERWPAWSPNGEYIAFVSNRSGESKVYVMNADGSGVRETEATYNDPGLVWSPDGQTLIYLKRGEDGTEDIYQLEVDGRAPVNLTNNPMDYYNPLWSPDAVWLAFKAKAGDGKPHLFLLNVENKGKRLEPLGDIDPDFISYAWSPDGHYLFLWGQVNANQPERKAVVYLYDMETRTLIDVLVNYPVVINTSYQMYHDWSADRQSLFLASEDDADIYRLNLDTNLWEKVIAIDDHLVIFRVLTDGHIVYGTERVSRQAIEWTGIYQFNPADQTLETILPAPFASFSLSPDKSKLLAVLRSRSSESLPQSLVVDIASGRQTFFDLLVFNGFGTMWSPDSQYLVTSICVINRSDVDADIYVLDATTGEATNLTVDDAFSGTPPAESECAGFG